MEKPMSANDNLETWLAQEQEIQQRMAAGPGPGVARPDQIAGKTGLAVMQAMLQGELPYAAIAQTLDVLIVEVGDGSAVFQGTPGPQHLNPMGTVHGGWFATLLDSALGCAVHTKMPPGRAYGPDGTLYAHATTTCLVFDLQHKPAGGATT
jgi:acyl-coenzyme A thioesterase PaaI-like protein